MDNKKEYFLYIDELKGLGMFLVVMAHALAWSHEDFGFLFHLFAEQDNRQVDASLVFKAVYAFHMPLLFMVSGYLFYSGKFGADEVKKKFKGRCLRILLPYIATGFMEYAYAGRYGHWFLQVLLVLNVLVLVEYFLLEKFKWGRIPEFAVHVALYLCLRYASKIEVHQDIYLSQLPSAYMAFILGLYLRRYAKLSNLVKSDAFSLCMIAVFVFLYGASIMLIIPSQSFFVVNGLSVSMSLFLFAMFSKRKESQSAVGRVLQLMGKYSLEIYVLHIYFVPHIYEIGHYFLSPIPRVTNISLQIVYSSVTAFVAISISLAVAKLLSYNKYLKLVLFGKSSGKFPK